MLVEVISCSDWAELNHFLRPCSWDSSGPRDILIIGNSTPYDILHAFISVN